MDIDSLRAETQLHLENYVGLSAEKAGSLVDAVCSAAQAELLGMISSGEPYPSSMSDLKALRLRYLCEAAERLLATQEVAVLFRVTDSAAQTLLTRMEVLYPAAVTRYLDALVETTGKAEDAGQAGDFRYRIRFTQLGAWQHAISMLQQAGLDDLRPTRSTLSIEPPRTIGSGKTARPTLDILGIPAPRST